MGPGSTSYPADECRGRADSCFDFTAVYLQHTPLQIRGDLIDIDRFRQIKPAKQCLPIDFAKPDITFSFVVFMS